MLDRPELTMNEVLSALFSLQYVISDSQIVVEFQRAVRISL